MRRFTAFCILVLFVSAIKSFSADEAGLAIRAAQVFAPLPARMPGAEKDSPVLIRLGKKLYFDKRLSANHQLSCNTCHAITDGGGYPRGIPKGASGKHSERNSPTVWNAGFQFAQFWDGRAATLEEQALNPMLNPDEMGMPSESELLKRLAGSFVYRLRFKAAFPDDAEPIKTANIAQAVAAFERTLITHDSFDDYLRGADGALNRNEKRGLEIFLNVGCQQCHDGCALGGNSLQKLGKLHAYETTDNGREKVTHVESDRYRFKVPPLRNVALRGPYFHDGSIFSLQSAVRTMAYVQLDVQLSNADVEAVTDFLKSLSDKKIAITKRQMGVRIQQ